MTAPLSGASAPYMNVPKMLTVCDMKPNLRPGSHRCVRVELLGSKENGAVWQAKGDDAFWGDTSSSELPYLAVTGLMYGRLTWSLGPGETWGTQQTDLAVNSSWTWLVAALPVQGNQQWRVEPELGWYEQNIGTPLPDST